MLNTLRKDKEAKMERIKFLLVGFLMVSLLGFVSAPPILACTNLGLCLDPGDEDGSENVVGCTTGGFGKLATTDGSVITFQSADCGSCDTALWLIPAADHKPGDVRVLQNIPQVSGGGPIEDKIITTPYSIPQVPHTYKYFRGVFGHMNEHQLGISESTRGATSKVNNPNGIMCVTELSRLAMERCTTAREAIELMGSIAEQYGFHGYSAGETLEVADTEEVWHFEIYRPGPLWNPDPATGKDPTGRLGCAWVAQRVPDDEIVIMPNLPRIGEINLADPDNFMASANIFSLADEIGRHQPGEPYDMRVMYGSNMNASVRLWNIYRILAPSQFGNMPYSSNLRDYPFSFKPDTKLGVADICKIFRDSAFGTPYDNTTGIAAGPWGNPQHYNATRLAPTPSSEYIDITQSRGWLPDPIGGILWWANHTLNTSVPKPYYVGVNRIPKGENTSGRINFDPESYFWAFNFVNGWAQINWMGMYPSIRNTYNALEAQQYADIPTIDAEALKIYNREKPWWFHGHHDSWKWWDDHDGKWHQCEHRDHPMTSRYLTKYCMDNAENVVSSWWDLSNYLMVNFDSNSFPRNNADGVRITPQANWLKVAFP